uniref:Uncharacterized protein n=1 Tax=Anguilla anguilla TaxID=7936 RepID=A0A0E9VVK0_ANGAN
MVNGFYTAQMVDCREQGAI